MTLDDLMKDKKPGEIRVRHANMLGYFRYFTPYFQNKDQVWFGLSESGFAESYDHDLCGWSIYTEPKKKVKRWLWAYKSYNGKWNHSSVYFTDSEAKHHFLDDVPVPIKIPQSEMEFEE